MKIAYEDLDLEHLWVIYPGDVSYPLASGIDTLPITKISTSLQL
jgi:hypothetical protein